MMAQETISFETNEGYTTGSLHNQNGWEVTEGSDGVLSNQILTNEAASDGEISFKNAHEPDFDFQWLPIFGAAKSFETPLDYDGFSISYDIMVTQQLGADFEFTTFGISESEEFFPIAGLGMENRGLIYIISSIDYDFEYIDGVEWEQNVWYNIKIEVSETEIKYYFNDELIYTGNNFTQLNVAGFNMLHNNYGGSAYYDNIKINNETMGIDEIQNQSITVYPNPVKDFINIQLPSTEKVKNIEIISLTGQRVAHSNSEKSLSLGHLSQGVYVLKITTDSGTVFTKKILKK